jgi:hypothetical protein
VKSLGDKPRLRLRGFPSEAALPRQGNFSHPDIFREESAGSHTRTRDVSVGVGAESSLHHDHDLT